MAPTKAAIVTGGTSGIGRAITLALARRGDRVLAIGHDAPLERETRAALSAAGLAAELMQGDVADPDTAARAVARAIALWGRIDVLCNNAAIRPTGTILDTDEAVWDRCFAVNIKGMYLFSRAVIPHMIAQGGGAIVNTASGSSYGGAEHIAYTTSKGAVLPFTKSLAVDHARHRIRANAVVPGVTLTGMTDMMAPERMASIADASVAGRMGMPDDIARVVAYLTSDDAATVTGAIWDVGSIAGQMAMRGNIA